MEQLQTEKHPSQTSSWLKKIGIAGFLFFLIKGLVWLGLILGVGKLFN